MRLFGRKWSVQINRSLYEDIDMAFRIERTVKPHPNTCDLTLYNLSPQQRAELAGTPLVPIAQKSGPAKHQHKGIPVRITAGYEDADCVIWQGDLRTVESKKNGPDWVTELGSGDGEQAYQRSRINLSFAKGTAFATVIKAVVKAIGLGEGNLALYLPRLAGSPTIARIATQGIVLSGSASQILTDLASSVGLEWSIQDGVLQFTERGLPVFGRAVFLSKDTGMIESPSVDNEGVLTVKMLMIPHVVPGSVLVVDSRAVKGNYRIETAHYEGDTSGQPWYITATCKKY